VIDSGVTREEVPPGYQRTEVGVIPEDWDIKTFNDVTLKIQDGTHFSPRLGGNDYLYVTSRNIGPGKLDVSDVERISKEEHRKIYARCDTKKGDLLLTKDGVNTGNAAINTLNEECSLLSSVAFLRFDMERHDPRFYLYFILSDEGQKQIKSLMSGNAITRLTLQKIRRLIIPVPLLPEQRAIATALSDVGELIGALDALIEKKRAIKQAAMQQLLTGKTRLPGFEGKWSEKSLGELASITMGQSPPSKYYNLHGDGLPLIQGNADLIERHTIARVWTTWAAKHCNAGDLLLTVRAPVGSVGIATQDSCLGRGVCGLKPLGDTAFLFQALINSEAQWRILEQGSTFTSANSKQIEQFRLICPEDEGEQHAIAAVLSDMDAEIAALERRREKAEQIKQGMMQQLLTGRIRLVEPPGTAA